MPALYCEPGLNNDLEVPPGVLIRTLGAAPVGPCYTNSGADAGVVDRVASCPPFSSDCLNGKKPCSILFNSNGTQIQYNVQGCVQDQVYSYNALLSSYNTEGLHILLGC